AVRVYMTCNKYLGDIFIRKYVPFKNIVHGRYSTTLPCQQTDKYERTNIFKINKLCCPSPYKNLCYGEKRKMKQKGVRKINLDRQQRIGGPSIKIKNKMLVYNNFCLP
ncbi:unnamed protein product, partial [Owenia fusiformis]